ncbi:hypothetical protein MYX77_01040 [Acidobacteriia bacterium AH_259_A11_L15]|nr:hypothetical protein [Acidobacteriia bacterium AH_259_A11_L15]
MDASVVADFHLTGSLELLLDLFAGRMLISDFVEKELAEADIQLPQAEIAPLTSAEEWQFLGDIRGNKPGLGSGELGALTVAQSHAATLLTNDRQARQTAEELQIAVSGAIGVLEYAVEIERISGGEAVRILEDMIREGAWISEELVEMFRQKVLERE